MSTMELTQVMSQEVNSMHLYTRRKRRKISMQDMDQTLELGLIELGLTCMVANVILNAHAMVLWGTGAGKQERYLPEIYHQGDMQVRTMDIALVDPQKEDTGPDLRIISIQTSHTLDTM